jgi:hypothetical protein
MKSCKFFASVMAAAVLSLGMPLYGADAPTAGNALVAQAFDRYTVSHYTVDPSSIWCSDDNSTFGAGVTDNNTGEYFTATYQLVKISSKVIDVMESKNSGDWVQIGTIDWNYMCNADIRNALSGGPLFRRVATLAAQSRGYSRMF